LSDSDPILKNRAISDPDLSSQETLDFQIERPDWALFRSINTLPQKAGVQVLHLRRLALKELADNALDAAGTAKVYERDTGGYVIEDDGPGIHGGGAAVARMFSIDRPLVSTKVIRRPTRGALGNGLRVVAGSLIASGGGRLIVETMGERHHIAPRPTGGADVRTEPCERLTGTRIEIAFGPHLPTDEFALLWARTACRFGGENYGGKSSPHWYDDRSFHDLLMAAGDRPVRELVAALDGCSGAKAAEIVAAFERRKCSSLSLGEAHELLSTAKAGARVVKADKLPRIGERDGWHYSKVEDYYSAGVPFVVEVWGMKAPTDRMDFSWTCVNRTPITSNLSVVKDSDGVSLNGCGLSWLSVMSTKPKKGAYLGLNISTPWMPITSDGKAPDFSRFTDAIVKAMGAVLRKIPNDPVKERVQINDVVFDHIDAAIAKVSSNGAYRFNQRQLLYALRPIVKELSGRELTTDYFNTVIIDYEVVKGEIPGMYREPRGSLFHPHIGETLSLGTLSVEKYERPAWTYNKVIYIEKEGFSEALKAKDWPERHDAMITSSKGFATRAAKDLVDRIGEHDEPVQIFCVHDADGPGTLIHQTFQEATKARAARSVEIINIGLEPWEAVEMGLGVERFERPKLKDGSMREVPVADYILARTDSHDGERWGDWLQSHRVELNAMTTEEFIAWLTGKIEAHGAGKVVPPSPLMAAKARDRVEELLRERLTEKILREAKIDERVAAAMADLNTPEPIEEVVREDIEGTTDDWRSWVDSAATDCADEVNVDGL
jgi:hypothetical protein